MHEHHRAALDVSIEDARADEDVLACILSGSVARGWEREDSDVDVILVVTAEDYERRRDEWDLWYYREDPCDHPDVYLEGKYVDVPFLEAVAADGSEPARSAFVDSEVVYCDDPAIEDLVREIPVYPSAEREERIRTFYAQMHAYQWFVEEAGKREDAYLAHHAAAQLALFGGRLLLANAETLFPFHKWFTRELADLEAKPADTVDRMEALLADRTPAAADAYVTAIEEFREWETDDLWWPKRFLVDREWQWRRGQPALAEL